MHWLIRPWRQMFDFSGRATRREYWLLQMQVLLGYFGLVAAAGLVGNIGSESLGVVVVGVLLLFVLFAGIATVSAGVRRIHDHDKTGWLLLLSFVPLIGWVFLLIMTLTPGTPGENSYGYDPREGDQPSPEEMAAVFS